MDILAAAEKFGIGDLVKQCLIFLWENFSQVDDLYMLLKLPEELQRTIVKGVPIQELTKLDDHEPRFVKKVFQKKVECLYSELDSKT